MNDDRQNAGYRRLLRHALATEMILRLRPMMLHALKGPPQTILSALHMLQKSFDMPETAQTAANRTRYVDWIRESVHKLSSIGDSLLPQRLGLATEREPCNLTEITEHVVHLFRDEAALGGIEFTVAAAEGLPDIEAQREELKLALEALLCGVLDRTPQETPLTISLDRHDGNVIWSITVPPRPNAANPSEDAFELRFDVEPPQSGIGWHVAHGIATEHGGNIELEDNGANGWRLKLLLPTHPTRS